MHALPSARNSAHLISAFLAPQSIFSVTIYLCAISSESDLTFDLMNVVRADMIFTNQATSQVGGWLAGND